MRNIFSKLNKTPSPLNNSERLAIYKDKKREHKKLEGAKSDLGPALGLGRLFGWIGMFWFLLGGVIFFATSGCAINPPVWQQHLNNFDRQWKITPLPEIKEEKNTDIAAIRSRYYLGICKF